jgi:hypothetical protein
MSSPKNNLSIMETEQWQLGWGLETMVRSDTCNVVWF